MIYLVWIAIIAIVAVGAFVLLRPKSLQPSSQNELPSLERSIFNLQIGDIVQYMAEDWVVEGKLTYDEGGYSWFEYMLQEGDRIRWLSVEEDDIVEVSWLQPTDALEISGTPPKQLTFDGETYRRTGSGEATMNRVGNIRRFQFEQCRYYDYEGSGDKVISVEEWDGEIEVTVGKTIRPSELTLLPGSGRSVYRT